MLNNIPPISPLALQFLIFVLLKKKKVQKRVWRCIFKCIRIKKRREALGSSRESKNTCRGASNNISEAPGSVRESMRSIRGRKKSPGTPKFLPGRVKITRANKVKKINVSEKTKRQGQRCPGRTAGGIRKGCVKPVRFKNPDKGRLISGKYIEGTRRVNLPPEEQIGVLQKSESYSATG